MAAYVAAPPGYMVPYRTNDDIVIYLSQKQPTPSAVPFELQNYVTPELWADRVPKIARTAGRYSKPLFERIWTVFAILSVFVVPFVLWNVFASNIIRKYGVQDEFFYSDEEIRAFAFARLICTLITVGIALFFIVPIAIWKAIGKRSVARMLNGWAAADRLNLGVNAQLPIWRVSTPGVFRDSITLRISLPQDKPPSNFHPNAYLPSFINAPVDAPAYNHDEKFGRDRVGDVPLYKDEKKSYAGTFDELKV